MSHRIWVTLSVFFLVSLSSIGLYVYAWDSNPASEIEKLTSAVYNKQRPGGGRLWGANFTSVIEAAGKQQDLGRAQILLLRQPPSASRRRAQGFIYLAAGEWQKFIDLAKESPSASKEPDTLNNRGASFLALSEHDPTLLLKAADDFERASKLAPKAPEPLFNLVIIYRKLRFQKLVKDYAARYAAIDSTSPWNTEIANPQSEDESSLLERMEQLIRAKNVADAERLFKENPELWRRVAMQYALYEVPE